jgi:DNA-directed RNA polymerase subunit RPC12/RpoP
VTANRDASFARVWCAASGVSRRHGSEVGVAAHAGEKAQKTGDFHCAKCGEKVSAKEGHAIPKCPNGHTEFKSRTNEPGNKS